jgi:hypothetical protein
MGSSAAEIVVNGLTIAVLRSPQRRRTVSLELVDGRYLLRAPLSLSAEELQRLAGRLVERLQRQQRRSALNGDASLSQRAAELNQRYFGNQLPSFSIRYVTNQRRSYGSCTPTEGTIRISDQVAGLPEWVRDYVIVHELAHLLEANHGRRFWRLVNRYPLSERARGYLMALGLSEAGEPAADEAPAQPTGPADR